MIHTIETTKQAGQYLERFRRATTLTQQRAVVEEYQLFYEALMPEEQTQADAVMQVLWPEIDREVVELERLTKHAQQMLIAKKSVD